jgi:hypothetical protein
LAPPGLVITAAIAEVGVQCDDVVGNERMTLRFVDKSTEYDITFEADSGSEANTEPFEVKLDEDCVDWAMQYMEDGDLAFALAEYVHEQEYFGEQVTEEQIIVWRLEQIEEDIETPEQLLEEQERARRVMQHLLEDAVLEVKASSEPPVRRMLGCGANFVSVENYSNPHAVSQDGGQPQSLPERVQEMSDSWHHEMLSEDG